MLLRNDCLLSAIACAMPLLAFADTGDAEAKPLSDSRPNIIFILTDDQGMGDLSCMGNRILKTPHIDQLYAQSTRFTDFHVSSTCSPTRAALMSGRRPFGVGVTHTILQRERLALDVVTLPETLKEAGYATGLFGKWHLGDELTYLPQNRGFDEVLMHGAGGIGQYRWGDFEANTENTYFNSVLLHNDTVVKTEGFCTNLFFDAALSWIHQQHEKVEPYFAYISLNAPHSPMIAPQSYKQRFLDMGYAEITAARYGMIENIDDNVGRMMSKLSEWQALENTLIIFMTDNGMAGRMLVKQDGSKEPAFNAGMRGGKASPFEGGSRVPSFWYWQGRLDAGVDISALTAHIDVYPTLAELAGSALPEGNLAPMGRSMLPLFEDSQAEWPERTLFLHRGRWDDFWSSLSREESRYNNATVRTDRWRLVVELKDGEPKTTLSDIRNDPGETINLAGKYPEVVEELKRAYDQWWDSTTPYLINEGLPQMPSEAQPFPRMYEQQVRESGPIPYWTPGCF